MKTQIKRYIGWGLEGSLVQELLSPCSWDVPPSLHMDVFTNPKAVHFRDFYEASSHQHD